MKILCNANSFETEWVKSTNGAWEKAKLSVDCKGGSNDIQVDIKMEGIAQNSFQHFASALVQKMTFGRITDAFSKKFIQMTNPQDSHLKRFPLGEALFTEASPLILFKFRRHLGF